MLLIRVRVIPKPEPLLGYGQNPHIQFLSRSWENPVPDCSAVNGTRERTLVIILRIYNIFLVHNGYQAFFCVV
jgi:hypothetical protein